MDTTTSKSMHPLTAIAALSLTLFSLAGIGAITGLIPTSHSQSGQAPAAKAAETPPTPAPRAAVSTRADTGKASASNPAAHRAAAKRARSAEQAVRAADEPVKTARADAPVMITQAPPPPPYQPAPGIEPARPMCYECGVIESVREVEKKGAASGAGAAVGGIAGGILGNQTGGGRGQDVMTVLGAIGGAIAGHAIEKNTRKVKSYEIDIRFDDGSTRLISQDNPPSWRPGDRIRLVNGAITANHSY